MSKLLILVAAGCACGPTAPRSKAQPNELAHPVSPTRAVPSPSVNKAEEPILTQPLEVSVTAMRWTWTFSHKVGMDELIRPELHVPANSRVKLLFRSEDDLHRFTVSEVHINQSVRPHESKQNTLSINIDKPGNYPVFCSVEEESIEHDSMQTRLIVHEPGGFEAWFEAELDKDAVYCLREFVDEEREHCVVAQGEYLYRRHGCDKCHSIDGSEASGPTFEGSWGQTRRFTDGSVGKVDEDYVRESLKEPASKVPAGFEHRMPSFSIREHDVEALINWMKTL